MTASNSAAGAVQLSLQSDVPTSAATAFQIPLSGAEPERVPAISKAQAGGHCVTRRTAKSDGWSYRRRDREPEVFGFTCRSDVRFDRSASRSKCGHERQLQRAVTVGRRTPELSYSVDVFCLGNDDRRNR